MLPTDAVCFFCKTWTLSIYERGLSRTMTTANPYMCNPAFNTFTSEFEQHSLIPGAPPTIQMVNEALFKHRAAENAYNSATADRKAKNHPDKLYHNMHNHRNHFHNVRGNWDLHNPTNHYRHGVVNPASSTTLANLQRKAAKKERKRVAKLLKGSPAAPTGVASGGHPKCTSYDQAMKSGYTQACKVWHAEYKTTVDQAKAINSFPYKVGMDADAKKTLADLIKEFHSEEHVKANQLWKALLKYDIEHCTNGEFCDIRVKTLESDDKKEEIEGMVELSEDQIKKDRKRRADNYQPGIPTLLIWMQMLTGLKNACVDSHLTAAMHIAAIAEKGKQPVIAEVPYGHYLEVPHASKPKHEAPVAAQAQATTGI